MHDKIVIDRYDTNLLTIIVVIAWTIDKIDEHIQSMREIYANYFQNWQMMLNFLIDIFENFDLKRNLRIKMTKKLKSKISKIIKQTKLKIIEIAKFTFVAVDIEFFDATFACDIQKFSLFCEIANFVQRFRQCQHQYRESNLLILLLDCLRDSVLIWYKQQNEFEIEIVKKNLNEWLKVLITAFFTKFFANFYFSKFEIFTSNSSVSRFSSQYHFCFHCFVFFSSLIRLLQHNQSICKKVVCKHCEKVFDSKNKFHEHIR